MSSHFNYEIDERNMRNKLKDLQLPYREDAWNRFEAFSDSNKKSYKAPVLPDIKLNLNRNVILPVVFGAMIILFSMLLFNFVSINKTAEKPKTVKEQPVEAAPVKPEPQPLAQKTGPRIDTAAKKTEIKDTVKTLPPPEVKVQASVAVVPTPIVQQKTEGPLWTTTEVSEIYVYADIKSKVIGSTPKNQVYSILEETNYFIKVNFTQNGSAQIGYIRKNAAYKNGSVQTAAANPLNRKSRNRKAEVMESLQAPAVLPVGGGEEKEPELK